MGAGRTGDSVFFCCWRRDSGYGDANAHCRNTYTSLSPEIILTEFSRAAVALRQDEIISAFALFAETCHFRQERYVRRK